MPDVELTSGGLTDKAFQKATGIKEYTIIHI
jgi:hypothetical protein